MIFQAPAVLLGRRQGESRQFAPFRDMSTLPDVLMGSRYLPVTPDIYIRSDSIRLVRIYSSMGDCPEGLVNPETSEGCKERRLTPPAT